MGEASYLEGYQPVKAPAAFGRCTKDFAEDVDVTIVLLKLKRPHFMARIEEFSQLQSRVLQNIRLAF
jgi:hypothetical protein